MRIPTLRKHKTGQAYVRVQKNGTRKDCYFSKYGPSCVDDAGFRR